MSDHRQRTCFVVVIVMLILVGACGLPAKHTGAAPTQPVPSPLDGLGRGPALAIPGGIPSTPSASPSPFAQIPFPFPPGPGAHVAVFDRPRQEVFYYPGAGPGVENVFTLNPGQYYYDDTRNIYLLDAWREEQIKLVDGHEVGGFAFYPTFDGNYNLYFLGQCNPKLAALGIGFAYVKHDAAATPSIDTTDYATYSAAPSVTAPIAADISAYLGKPIFLAKINALAVLHGGLTSISVNGAGDAVVFTTADGGLFLYSPFHPQVVALLADTLIEDEFHAAAASIDPIWGRYVVWLDTKRRGVLCLDRWTGMIDTMPYANLALDPVAISVLGFYENDPFEVVFILTLRDGTTRLIAYNLVTELVLNLTILNAFTTLHGVRLNLN